MTHEIVHWTFASSPSNKYWKCTT